MAAAAPTQFMRDDRNHELCALDVTEAIVYQTRHLNTLVVHIYLDKESAFDSALKEHIIRETFSAAHSLHGQ